MELLGFQAQGVIPDFEIAEDMEGVMAWRCSRLRAAAPPRQVPSSGVRGDEELLEHKVRRQHVLRAFEAPGSSLRRLPTCTRES